MPIFTVCTLPIHTTKDYKQWYSQRSPKTCTTICHSHFLHLLTQTIFCAHCMLSYFVLHTMQPFGPCMSLGPRYFIASFPDLWHHPVLIAKYWMVANKARYFTQWLYIFLSGSFHSTLYVDKHRYTAVTCIKLLLVAVLDNVVQPHNYASSFPCNAI